MLSGKFVNCYGIKEFDMQGIDFVKSNKAVIYAPNGVMKTSLAQVFEDISQSKPSKDRIFPDATTSYAITHYTSQYNFTSANPRNLSSTEKIYVVSSFADKFEFTKETVSTLLADETTRNAYNVLVEQFSSEIRQIEERLRQLSGLTKPKIKGQLIEDLQLSTMSDWTDIIEQLAALMPSWKKLDYLNDLAYQDLFNEKALAIFEKPEFRDSIEVYITNLSNLLSTSSVLTERFTDRSAEALGKAFSGNNLFEANHIVQLRDGTSINSLNKWNDVIKQQLDSLYQDSSLSTVFDKLKKLLTTNNEASRVRDIIVAHREIIPLLRDAAELKKQVWLNYFNCLDLPFDDYHTKISEYTEQMRALYEQASAQSERWQEVVSEFNRRFRVPFEVQIDNKANYLLKDEAPNLSFVYTRGSGETQQTANLRKDDLMISLSMGEKRALYILYILFDLERIRHRAVTEAGKFLIITDDIADSFDYKNKYAIVEYLSDLSQNVGIDLLMLTHNFDFFRTVSSRLGVHRSNCYIAQRNEDGIVSMTVFKYQKDFFKKVIINGIKSGTIDTDEKKKLLLASIPFYRNLCEYNGDEDSYAKLTCFLHIKTGGIKTDSAKLSDLWAILKPYISRSGSTLFAGVDEDYLSSLTRIANDIVSIVTDEVSLENKLIVAIAIRLSTELFLKRRLDEEGQLCVDSGNNQTREWYNQAEPYLSNEERNIIDDVNLMTPESIHINSFMYEPLIDISDWSLKELYSKVILL